jgi:hypothetical protein
MNVWKQIQNILSFMVFIKIMKYLGINKTKHVLNVVTISILPKLYRFNAIPFKT